jgi:hypothetical protein
MSGIGLIIIQQMQEALTNLTNAGLRVIIVGTVVAHLDILRAFGVVPYVVAKEDVFNDFAGLRRELPAIIERIRARGTRAVA